jgi:hypothetical protein
MTTFSNRSGDMNPPIDHWSQLWNPTYDPNDPEERERIESYLRIKRKQREVLLKQLIRLKNQLLGKGTFENSKYADSPTVGETDLSVPDLHFKTRK